MSVFFTLILHMFTVYSICKRWCMFIWKNIYVKNSRYKKWKKYFSNLVYISLFYFHLLFIHSLTNFDFHYTNVTLCLLQETGTLDNCLIILSTKPGFSILQSHKHYSLLKNFLSEYKIHNMKILSVFLIRILKTAKCRK